MSKVLPRKHEFEIEPTMLIRTRDPSDHRQFEEILPWFTPLFVWRGKHWDWVRWSVPKDAAERMGLTGGCVACGHDHTADGEHGDVLIDTAWPETSWWLEANGYTNPDPPTVEEPMIPTQEKRESHDRTTE